METGMNTLEQVQSVMLVRKHQRQVGLLPRTSLRRALGSSWSPMPIREARAAWKQHRITYGLAPFAPALLTSPTGNVKLDKTQAYGLSLAPANISGYNVCPYSTQGCRQACLNTVGKGAYNTTQARRIVKTRFLYENPAAFATILVHEIDALYAKHGSDLRVRLNVLSDLRWEELLPQIFERAPKAKFYDYTKDVERVLIGTPNNYTLAVSASERMDEEHVRSFVELGFDVSVVFHTKRGQALPRTYAGQHVTDADKSDTWMLMRPRKDGRGRVGGLRAKGRAINDSSGFVKNPLGS